MRLTTIHNLHFVLKLMEQIRKSIRSGSLAKFAGQWNVTDVL
jgi:tRNA-guanine family transglycosylase